MNDTQKKVQDIKTPVIAKTDAPIAKAATPIVGDAAKVVPVVKADAK